MLPWVECNQLAADTRSVIFHPYCRPWSGDVLLTRHHKAQFVSSHSSVVIVLSFPSLVPLSVEVSAELWKNLESIPRQVTPSFCFPVSSVKWRLSYLTDLPIWCARPPGTSSLLLILRSVLSTMSLWSWQRSLGTAALQTNAFPLYSSFLICSYLNNQNYTYISGIRV